MHEAAFVWIRDTLATLPRPSFVLEYGSRNVNGSVRRLVPPRTPYIGLDLQPGECVDIVGDAADYRPRFLTPDLVLCAETLEHAPNAERLVRHALDLLRPGGHLVVTCAGPGRKPHSGVDGADLRDGEHYRNLSSAEVAAWVADAGGEVLAAEDHADRGDTYVLARRKEAS